MRVISVPQDLATGSARAVRPVEHSADDHSPTVEMGYGGKFGPNGDGAYDGDAMGREIDEISRGNTGGEYDEGARNGWEAAKL